MVLVIDDDADLRQYVRRRLSPLFTVVEASNALDAMRTTEDLTPNLILLDLGLPDMPGIELIGQLRARPHLAAVPVLLMTGMAPADLGPAAVAESTGILSKPFDARGLLGRVRGALGLPSETAP